MIPFVPVLHGPETFQMVFFICQGRIHQIEYAMEAVKQVNHVHNLQYTFDNACGIVLFHSCTAYM